MGLPLYQEVQTEEGADLEGVSLSEAKRHLFLMYGDPVHINNV